jgi:hypothetical protein
MCYLPETVMTQEQYLDWRKADPSNRRARFLRGVRDPITIMAVWTGREQDGCVEGFVIASDVPSYFPVGYVSFAWLREAFEFVEGEVTFQPA